MKTGSTIVRVGNTTYTEDQSPLFAAFALTAKCSKDGQPVEKKEEESLFEGAD